MSRWQPFKRLALDTSAFIYFIEHVEPFYATCSELFQLVENGKLHAVTSTLTMLELLVHPYRSGNNPLLEEYAQLLSGISHLYWHELDLVVAERAAELRAKYNIATPDAVQIATGIVLEAEAFVTNDQHLERVSKEINIVLISAGTD